MAHCVVLNTVALPLLQTKETTAERKKEEKKRENKKWTKKTEKEEKIQK